MLKDRNLTRGITGATIDLLLSLRFDLLRALTAYMFIRVLPEPKMAGLAGPVLECGYAHRTVESTSAE